MPGYIALNTGIAVGALVTLIPEVPYDLERDVIAKMKATQKTGKQHFIIIIAEGVGHAQDLANEIQSRTGIDSRATVLGHVQRGGSPLPAGPCHGQPYGLSRRGTAAQRNL